MLCVQTKAHLYTSLLIGVYIGKIDVHRYNGTCRVVHIDQHTGRVQPFQGSIAIYGNKNGFGVDGKAYVSRDLLSKNEAYANRYNVYISYAYGAGEGYPHQIVGRPFVPDEKSVCTQTYTVCGSFESKEEAENMEAYIKTKFFRFLVAMKKYTQHCPPSKFSFVPQMDMSKRWLDDDLYKHFNISADEILFIESIVRPME